MTMKFLRWTLPVLSLAFFNFECQQQNSINVSSLAEVNYEMIGPILEGKCMAACHDGSLQEDGLTPNGSNWSGYTEEDFVNDPRQLVYPGEPTLSAIYLFSATENPVEPRDGSDPLSEMERQLLKRWIEDLVYY